MGSSGGSGGGGSYFSANDIDVLREEARRRLEQSRIDSEVNSFLQKQLALINDRDTEQINEYVDQIETVLSDRIESLDRLLFGGSISKHTYVDGLSDVDMLVVMNDPSLISRETSTVLQNVRDALLRRLPQGNVRNIRVGRMAVTVEYSDGTEIQLLPAVRFGDDVSIPSGDGRSWTQVRPRDFVRVLTDVNRGQGSAAVPTIKLAKAIVAKTLGDSAPSGYHIESLAVSALRDYSGSRTPKAMLTRLFEHAAEAVRRPIRDITGQSTHVDDSLGPAESRPRRELSRTFRDIAKVMSGSTSMSEWRELLE